MILDKPNTKRRRIAAVGMYDGVHLGHRFLIDYLTLESRSRGMTAAVVTFRNHPMSVVNPESSPTLLMHPDEKMRRLEQAGIDDVIVLGFDDKMRHLSAHNFLNMLHKRWGIEALVVGFNNRFGHDRVDGIEQYRQIGAEIGIEILEAPEYKGISSPVSSSIIRQYIAQGEINKANEALGRPCSIEGTVIPGQRLGRTLGFPTANIDPQTAVGCVPAPGVYAAMTTTHDNVRRPTILNIGHRPTVESDPDNAPLSIEAHILDYSGYLYGEKLKVEFISKIRDERKFDSLDKLRKAITADTRKARSILQPDNEK